MHDTPKTAVEAPDGTFTIHTTGLAARGQAEVELVSVPAPAVHAAAKLLDYMLDASVFAGKKRLRANENIGSPLSISTAPEVEPVWIGARAIESRKARSGFFAALSGSSDLGSLRLIDIFDPQSVGPWSGIASTMLYRAECRRVTGDLAGAIDELRTSIRLFHGDPAAGPPPSLDVEGDINWQNTSAVVRLSELVDRDERDALLGGAYSRFEWLAFDHLGAPLSALKRSLQSDDLESIAREILSKNLSMHSVGPGPTPSQVIVESPIWMPDGDRSVRLASLIPRPLLSYAYGDHLRSEDAQRGIAAVVSESARKSAERPWELRPVLGPVSSMYNDESAPLSGFSVPSHPAHFVMSALIAATGRMLYAGATLDEIRTVLSEPGTPPPPELGAKLERIDHAELAAMMESMGGML